MSLLKVCKGHDGDVNHCGWSPVGSHIVTAGGDKMIRIWDPDTGAEVPQSPLRAHSYYVNCCVFNPNGDLLATSSSDGTIKLWSTTTWKPIGTLIGHKGSVKMCCFSPDGCLIASCGGGGDESLRIWDVNAMKCLNTFEKHECSVNCCSFAAVGWLLCSGGSSGELILSDVFSNRLLRKTFAHDMGVSWLQFADGSPNDDKFLLATVGLDNSLKLWNVQLSSKEGIKLMNTLEGHTAAVYSCQFSYDLKYIATASADKSVIVWNLTDGRILKKIDAHSRYVTFCCFSPCGKRLASTSNDKTLKIWSMAEPEQQNDDKTSENVASTISTVQSKDVPKSKESNYPKGALNDTCSWLSNLIEEKSTLGDDEREHLTKLSRLVICLENTQSTEGIESHLKCPITQEFFQDPVIGADGHTYERSAIMSWLKEGNRRSPVTNTILPNTTLIPNHCIKAIKVHHVGK